MTDRVIIQVGAELLDTDILSLQRFQMMALGYLAEAVGIGGSASSYVDGLALSAGGGLTLNVGRGCMFALSTIDATGFGSLPADTNQLVKVGINEAATPITFVAPTTAGQSVNYLIEGQFTESDTTPIVLPYYNAANPNVVFWGPGGLGGANNTQRVQRVGLTTKMGTPATTGTQTTPAVDAGYTALYVVTVAQGQTTLTPANTVRVGPWLTFKARNANARAFFMGMN